MSTDERKPNPNATIQLDQIEGALDQVQLDDEPAIAPSASKKPPPLPPMMPMSSAAPPPAVATASLAPPSPAKKLGAGMVVAFVALLALAIGGGLYVGLHAPAKVAPAPSAASAPSAAPSVTAAAPASVQHFTLPTME